MSKKQFEVILKTLSFTSHQPPAFRDRFWEVWEMLDVEHQHDRTIHSKLGQLLGRVHEHMDQQVQLPNVAIWQ